MNPVPCEREIYDLCVARPHGLCPRVRLTRVYARVPFPKPLSDQSPVYVCSCPLCI